MVRYNWSPGIPRNTMKIERDFITNENDAQINWDYNGATTYTVVNKDQKNQYGEYRGYTVTPGKFALSGSKTVELTESSERQHHPFDRSELN